MLTLRNYKKEESKQLIYKAMENIQTITIKEYLDRKGVEYREFGKELIAKCFFNACDEDSKGNEAHLYFNTETGQYDCKKCGEKGNIFTLAKHFGDSVKDIALYPPETPKPKRIKAIKFDPILVEKCHFALPDYIIEYLNNRGIPDDTIQDYQLGWGNFYNQWWVTIPIKDKEGNFIFFKLRQDPSVGNEKMTYPKGVEAQIYGWEILLDNPDAVIVCEGELDRLALACQGFPAITSTHGAMTFKSEWVDLFPKQAEVYICFDNDEAGRKGSQRIAQMLVEKGVSKVSLTTLPNEVGDGGDITDFLIKLNGNPDDLFYKYAKPYPEQIDTSQFQPLSSQELIQTLGLTIKRDEENKLITFLCQLSAYTENSQLNISFNAPSSTGKSYIPTEISQLFPEDDVIEIGYCSPTAFFHDVGKFDKEKEGYIVDLSRKILIFLDQPHTLLLQHLRPMLSHDKKEIRLKITDKSQKAGLRTKNIFLKGFPAVIFCTAGLQIDEQESTRFLLLSPEINQEKIREAIHEKIKKETDSEAYHKLLEENPERQQLKERIRAIRQEHIENIKICSKERIEEMFFKGIKVFKPRHQRDIGRITSIIKAFALLNLWFREKEGATIVANEEDIQSAFTVWRVISESQELNLPPYVYDVYQDVIVPAWQEKCQSANGEVIGATVSLGLTRQEIMKKHFQVTGRLLVDWFLRQQIIPMLENSGLITQEADPNDKRRILVYPTTSLTISPQEQNNSESEGGAIKNEEPQQSTISEELDL